MTSFALFTPSTTAQTLNEGETGFVGPSAQLVVAGGPAIQLVSAGTSVTVLGTVLGKLGISGPLSELARVVVGDQGAVAGKGTAIRLDGGAEIVNGGLLNSEHGLALKLHDGQNHLVNTGMIAAPIEIAVGATIGFDSVNHLENGVTGVIAGGHTALDVRPQLATREMVINDGAIYGDVNLRAMSDVVVNRGTIVGQVRLGADSDTYRGGGVVDGTVLGGGGDDLLKGGAHEDTFLGGGGQDDIRGRQGDDTLAGGPGRDIVNGGNGDDTLIGGMRSDLLTGGRGADHFVFDTLLHPGRDMVTDFQPGTDLLDFSRIFPQFGSTAHLAFIGTQDFSGTQSEIRYAAHATKTIISADFNGDGTSDLKVALVGHFHLAESDFVL
jgi:Ca2+-binding RTX toxin-like protein